MARYLYHPTHQFTERMEKIRRNDPAAYKRIRAVIDRLLENPLDADGKMHGGHRGRLKKYVGKGDYRILYHWCELCRKANEKQYKECRNCETIPDQSVIFFDIYHKAESRRVK